MRTPVLTAVGAFALDAADIGVIAALAAVLLAMALAAAWKLERS